VAPVVVAQSNDIGDSNVETSHNLKFQLKKVTKGSVAYEEINEQGEVKREGYVVGTIYVRKTALSASNHGSFPARIAITVTVTD